MQIRPIFRASLLTAVTALVITGTITAGPASAASDAKGSRSRPITAVRQVPDNPLVPHRPSASSTGLKQAKLRPPVWPQEGTATVEAASASKPAKLPAAMAITLTTPATSTPAPVTSTPPTSDSAPAVTVRSYGPARARTLGGIGVAFSVTGSPSSTGVTRTGIRISAGGFAKSYGGDLLSHLSLAQRPACALTTPQAKACRTLTPVASHVEPTTATVVADVPVAVSGAPAPVFVLLAGPSGQESGDFGASSIGVASTWSAGGQSGGFSWTYPMAELDPPGGDSPGLQLAYSSQSVDGLVGSQNTQATWAGLGWDLAVPSIERQYKACPAQTDPVTRGDRCWAGDVLSLSMAGHSSPLVKDTAAGTDVWRPRDDPGWTVRRLHTTGNGDNDGEYFEVTTSEGTRYTFGRGAQPVTGTATNSVFTVPVFGLKAGDPCHAATSAASWCQQGWRWNVDSIVDGHGNAQTYYYTQETNRYRRWGATGTAYVRGGHVRDIEYGQQDGHQDVAAPLRLHLDAAPRCTAAADGTGTCPALSAANSTSYPDVPTYLLCATGDCTQVSPSFFTGDLLRSITMQRRSGTTWSNVDQIAMRYSFPQPSDPNDDAYLWLEAISRTGLAGGSTTTVPDVTFGGIELTNRVDANPAGGVPLLRKLRINKAIDELGRQVEVTYGQQNPCSPANTPEGHYDQNTQDCFPALRVNGDSAAGYGIYYKYLVTNTVVRDNAGGGPAQTTQYIYRGTPAWHHDEDLTDPDASLSWGDWRGYGQVDQEAMSDPAFRGGASQPLSLVRTRFFRGMDGDLLSAGGTKNVQVTDSQGGSVPDTAWLNGRERENQQFHLDAAGNPDYELGGSITSYTSARTIQAGASANAQKDAHLVVPTSVATRTTVIAEGTGARSTRTTLKASTYDNLGQLLTVTSTGASASDVRCSRSTYARDAATVNAGLVSFPYRIRSYEGTCAAPAKLVTAQDSYYDGSATLGAPLTHGDPTRIVSAVTATGPDTVGTTIATSSTFDSYGRTITSADGRGGVTRTAFSPATGLPATQTATNALGQATTLTFDPDRRLPISSKDANGQVTTTAYDGLGRMISVRLPGQAAGDPPAWTYAYSVDPARARAARITTRQLQSGSTYLTSYQYLDSLARPRQTQSESPQSTSATPATLLTDTRYDDRGQSAAQTAPLVAPGAAGTQLIAVAPGSSDETRTTYDTAGRTISSSVYAAGTLKWSTATAYFGDHARTTPPSGGVAKTSWTDVWDRIVRSDDGTGADLTTTTYRYDAADRVIATTDPAGHTGTTTYDLLGRATASSDPDAGASTVSYDANGNPVTTTDAKGGRVTAVYDALDRPTATWSGASGTGTRLHSFSYDSTSVPNAIGRLTSQSTYDAGKTYSQSVTAYDARGRVTGTRWDFPAGLGFRLIPATFTIGYQYDVAGHTTAISYGDDLPGAPKETISTGYDSLGYARTLTSASPGLLGTTTTPLVSDTGFAGDGKLISRSYANPLHPLSRQYSYEPGTQRLSNIKTLAGNPLNSNLDTKQNDDYAWDPAGNLTRITDQTTVNPLSPNPVNTCFGYDGLDRLTHAWTSTQSACSDSSSTLTHDGPAGMNESWTYSPDGNLTSARSLLVSNQYTYGDANHPHAVTKVGGLDSYSYDANGALTSRVQGLVPGALSWNVEHELASASTGLLTTKFVYNASGSRLVRFNPDGSATLYLDGEEISIVKGITTGTRYYTIGSTTVAERTPLGLTWQLNDVQGSAQLSVPSGLSIVNRTYYDPYGKIRSGLGASDPPTDHGFLGSVRDPLTGLNSLGARYYDAGLARFISVDPASNQASAQAANAYAYGNNNPVVFTDPTGLWGWSSITHAVSSAASWVVEHKQQIASVAVGIAVGVAVCATGIGCAAELTFAAAGALAASGAAGNVASYGFDVATGAVKNPSVGGVLKAAGFGAAGSVLTLGAGKFVGAALRRPAAALVSSDSALARVTGKTLQKLDVPIGGKSGAGKGDPVPSGPKQEPGTSATGGGDTGGSGSSPGGKRAPTSCALNSFGAGTLVRMADGTATPIEQIRTGDVVVSVDPKTGRDVTGTVTAAYVNQDHQFTDLQFTSADGGTTSLHTTSHHRIWDQTTHTFVNATDLKSGHQIRTTDGQIWTLASKHSWRGSQRMYDITVGSVHTFYVLARTTPILVHNCGGVDDALDAEARFAVNSEGVATDLSAVRPSTPYARPSGATTTAQRASVQGQPCVDCGATTSRQVADHIDPLVKEYYRTGSIDLIRMRSLSAVQSQCSVCSASQGGRLAQFSRAMRKVWGF